MGRALRPGGERHLRAAGQDRLRTEPGAERRAAGHGGRRDRAERNSLGGSVRELRARHDEPAAGDARIDGSGHRRIRGSDAARSRIREGVGGARRRLLAQGRVPQHAGDDPQGDGHRAARAGDRSGDRRRARVPRHESAVARAGG